MPLANSDPHSAGKAIRGPFFFFLGFFRALITVKPPEKKKDQCRQKAPSRAPRGSPPGGRPAEAHPRRESQQAWERAQGSI